MNIFFEIKTSNNNIKNLITGIILCIISISGLFLDTKLALKLVMYIIPIILIIYSLKTIKMALYFKKNYISRFIILFIQALLIITLALYIIFNPIESLNYLIILGGLILLINCINNIIFYKTRSYFQFILAILCIVFSNEIINTFYTIFLISILFIGISKITTYLYLRKKTY